MSLSTNTLLYLSLICLIIKPKLKGWTWHKTNEHKQVFSSGRVQDVYKNFGSLITLIFYYWNFNCLIKDKFIYLLMLYRSFFYCSIQLNV